MVFSLLLLLVPYIAQTYHLEFIPSQKYGSIGSVFIESSSALYFHSGLTENGKFLNGLTKTYYDTDYKSWRSQEQSGTFYPDSRSDYGGFLYLNQFYYIFGGIGPNGIYNDIWNYDIIYERWNQVFVSAPISHRSNFAYTTFTYLETFYFAVLGGESYYNTEELFDFYL